MQPGVETRKRISGTEAIVPVLGGRTESADGRMKLDHALGHSVAGGIGVKGAKDGQRLLEEQA